MVPLGDDRVAEKAVAEEAAVIEEEAGGCEAAAANGKMFSN